MGRGGPGNGRVPNWKDRSEGYESWNIPRGNFAPLYGIPEPLKKKASYTASRAGVSEKKTGSV